jgi:hypothetical protein
MARLDKSRKRVICDDYGLCGTVLARVEDLPEAGGRVLMLEPGWLRGRDRVWRFKPPRTPLAPGQRGGAPPKVTGKSRGRFEIWPTPMLDRRFSPQSIACWAPTCRLKDPQPLDPEALDVLAVHPVSGYVKPLRIGQQ